MALNTRGSVDPRWLTHNQAVGYALQLATVRVYNTDSANQTYDPATNTFTGTSTDIYTGPARIQPMSNPSDTAEEYNPTTLQMVKVVLPLNKNTLTGGDGLLTDIRPNDRMIVTDSPYNESLEKFVYTVMGVMNSSNAWERTLVCRVDTELDPTNA